MIWWVCSTVSRFFSFSFSSASVSAATMRTACTTLSPVSAPNNQVLGSLSPVSPRSLARAAAPAQNDVKVLRSFLI